MALVRGFGSLLYMLVQPTAVSSVIFSFMILSLLRSIPLFHSILSLSHFPPLAVGGDGEGYRCSEAVESLLLKQPEDQRRDCHRDLLQRVQHSYVSMFRSRAAANQACHLSCAMTSSTPRPLITGEPPAPSSAEKRTKQKEEEEVPPAESRRATSEPGPGPQQKPCLQGLRRLLLKKLSLRRTRSE